MEALASRVGRFESQLEAIRREVFQLQGQSSAPSAPASQGQVASSAQLQWVRLFERELEQLKHQAESYEEPLALMEHRLQRLESVALPESGRDLDELAELVLSELQELQAQVAHLASEKRGPGQAIAPRGLPVSAATRSPTSAAAQRVEMLQRLERSAVSLEERMQRLEQEVVPPDSHGEGTESKLQQRLHHLEQEVQVALQPLRRHQVSLQVLEETSMKVEKLQDSLKHLPLDAALKRSDQAIHALEAAGGQAAGAMSLLDGHKVQAGLDQLFTAMEALARQRNQDVQLVNGYLGEVYRRIERDLPVDKGQSIIQSLNQLQNQHQVLKAECRAILDVRLPELETRLLHEASSTAELADQNRRQITRLELATQDAMDQLASAQARLPALQDATDRRAAAETRREAQAAELRQELMHLRQDFAQLTMDGSMAPGSIGEKFHASLAAVQATLLARIEKEGKEKLQSLTAMERQLLELQERTRHAEVAGSSASTFAGDLQMLAQDFATLRGESARADVELRERVARGERELKAEIRAAQRLLLEVAESARHLSPERLTAPSLSSIKAAPAEPASLPALPGFGTGASTGVQLDVGSLAAHDEAVEWTLPGVRARARLGNSQPLISEAFDVDRFPEIKALRLKLFPLGSRRRTKPGHCSLYLTGPQGAHLQFLLRLGSVEHGPLECIFDRPEKDSGRHDFCALEDELEVDGSAIVHLTILRADLV
ncbi:unnamed protein product [Effrenium voratum]|uniref:Uncharacterized protein n=1 Tax=Effrenium voratum TaxID=2562239 RepID=A0AA36HKY3_9DINO|nr:unnamed protein product [Effrenium voratum]